MKISNEIESRNYIGEIRQRFALGKYAILTGRVIGKRPFRDILFFHLKDQSGAMQLIFDRNISGEEIFTMGKKIKLGDIILVKGKCYITKKNEKSLLVKECSVLTHNQTPGFIGFKKVKKTPFHKERYIELAGNQEKFKYHADCSSLIFYVRQALYNRGFLEFNTGILQSHFEGGLAEPFETYLKARNKKLYLRPTTEIKLKQLLASGYEKIFEIGNLFRNEGFSSKSSPEFILLDCYWAFKDYHDMMILFETVIKEAALKTFGKFDAQTPQRVTNLLEPWKKKSFTQVLQEMLNEEVSSFRDKNNLKRILLEHRINPSTCRTEGEMIRRILEKIIIPKTIFPTYITEIPLAALPLAKASSKNEEISEGAILAIDRMFVGDVYTDENDPDIMKGRLIEQSRATGKPVNENFINLLKFGVPPSAGFGLGVNKLLLVFRGNWGKDVRETFVFPPFK